MSTLSLRTSAASLGLSTLLLTGLLAAQPTTEWSQSAAPQNEPSAPPAAPEKSPGAESSKTPPSTTPAATATAPQTNKAETSVAPQPSADSDDAPQTLFRPGMKIGGYGGLDVAYTRLAGHDAALFCGSGALLADHTFSLGLMGCGNATRISGQSYGDAAHESGDRLEFGYGGLVLGYHFFPKRLYNLSLTALVGAGGAAIVNFYDGSQNDNWHEHHDVKTHDTLFVAEPRLTGYVNLTRWARMGAFVGYRFVGGADMKNLSESDLAGPVAGGTIQFGWF